MICRQVDSAVVAPVRQNLFGVLAEVTEKKLKDPHREEGTTTITTIRRYLHAAEAMISLAMAEATGTATKTTSSLYIATQAVVPQEAATAAVQVHHEARNVTMKMKGMRGLWERPSTKDTSRSNESQTEAEEGAGEDEVVGVAEVDLTIACLVVSAFYERILKTPRVIEEEE